MNDEDSSLTLPKQNTEAGTGVTVNVDIPERALICLEGAVDVAIVHAVIEGLQR